MNIKDAFNYVKSSENFIIKFIPFFLLVVINLILTTILKGITDPRMIVSFLVLFSIVIPLTLIQSGYQVHMLRNYMLCRPEILPDFTQDFKAMVFNGFKYVSASCIYITPVFICSLISFKLIKINFLAFLTSITGCYILGALAVILIPALTITFAYEFKFWSFFNFKRAYSLISTLPQKYFITFGTVFLLSIPVIIIQICLKNYILLMSIINGSYLAFYAVIWAILFGDVFRKFVEIHKHPEENKEN